VRSHSWTKAEHTKLRRLYARLPLVELSRIFKRSPCAVKSRAQVLGLKRGNRKPWTSQEDAKLRRLYADMPTNRLVRVFRRPIGQIYHHAARLGLSKSPEYKAKQNLKNARNLVKFGAAHRFPKGHVPMNKGIKRPGWSAGRMRETQFKQGQRSGAAQAKWCPVGTVKFNGDGYLRRKIADQTESIAGKGGLSTNWEFVHIRVWTDANGPIPKGYRIWWKDGDHGNCALENLELLGPKEHMARTTVHNLPPDLKQVIQLNGALKRQIRRRFKGEEKYIAGPERSSVRDAGRASGPRQGAGR
jgi:hypothetical protein